MQRYRYYAIRVHNAVIIRRVLGKLKRVTSSLYKPGTEFALKQVTYTGGLAIGSVPYNEWVNRGLGAISINGCQKISREKMLSVKPIMFRGQ